MRKTISCNAIWRVLCGTAESENQSCIKELVQRLKNKSFKPLPSLRVYIPKGNGKKRPLGIASYEDKIVQMAVKKILGAIYEPRFLNCMYGFRPNRGARKIRANRGRFGTRLSNESDACKYIHASCADAVV